MASDEPLTDDPLHIAATRPAIFGGIPWVLAVGIILFGVEMLVVFGIVRGLKYGLPMVGILWAASFAICRHDYNGPRIIILWLDTSARALDAVLWGGASPAPLPIRAPRRFRGIRGDV